VPLPACLLSQHHCLLTLQTDSPSFSPSARRQSRKTDAIAIPAHHRFPRRAPPRPPVPRQGPPKCMLSKPCKETPYTHAPRFQQHLHVFTPHASRMAHERRMGNAAFSQSNVLCHPQATVSRMDEHVLVTERLQQKWHAELQKRD
jgi:hypothetical protein